MADNILGIPSTLEDDENQVRSAAQAFGVQSMRPEDAFGAKLPSPALDFLEAQRDVSPDKLAQDQRTADNIGVTREVVEAAPDEARRIEERQTYERLFGQAPITQSFFEQSPDTAALARDSVEQLSFLEGVVNGLSRGRRNIESMYQQYLADQNFEQSQDAGRSFGEILESMKPASPTGFNVYNPVELLSATERWATSRLFGDASSAFRYRQGEVGRLMEEKMKLGMSTQAQSFTRAVEEADGFLAKVAAAASDPIGLSAFSAEVGVEFIPQLLTASAVTAATRNPTAGAVTLGAGSFGTERYLSAVDFLQAAGIDMTDPAQVDALLLNEELYAEAQRFGFSRGAIIGAVDTLSGGVAGMALARNPVANLALQTLTQGAFGGAGEAAAQYVTTGEIDSTEVILEAVGEFATAPIEIVGVGGRPLINRVREMAAQGRAQASVETLDKIVEAAQASPLTERAPEKAAEHIASTFEAQGVSEVYVPVSALDQIISSGVSPTILEDLGISEKEATDARLFDGDIRIDAKAFSQHVLQQPDTYASLRDNIRMDQDALTNAEAQESVEFNQEIDEAAISQSLATVSRDTAPDAAPVQENAQAEVGAEEARVYDRETTQSVNAAEHELGMYALFEDAQAAGLNDTEYQSYIVATVEARQARLAAKESRRLRRDLKRQSAEYQAQRETFRQEVEESVRNEPLYQAWTAIGRDRLNRAQVIEALGGNPEAINKLPKRDGRSIVAPQSERGIDIDIFADRFGFEGGDILLYALMDQPPMEKIIEARLEAKMHEVNPTLMSNMAQIKEALEAIHSADSAGAILNFELNALRKKLGKKKLKRAIVKARAMAALDGYRLSNISPSRFETMQRREARRARKAFKAGDFEAAATHKMNQMIAYEMTRQSYKIREEVKNGNKFMAKFLNSRKRFKTTPIDHVLAIKQILSSYQFGAPPKNLLNLQRWIDERKEDGVVMDVDQTVLNADGTKNINSLTMAEWRALKNSVKEIDKAGRDANKLRQQDEKIAVELIGKEIGQGFRDNLRSNAPRASNPNVTEIEEVSRFQTMMDNFKDARVRYGDKVANLLLSAETILRMADGWKSLGPAYTYIKGGIDKAFTEGYGRIKINGEWVNRIGYVPRLKQESERLVTIMETFDKQTRNKMGREIRIPGVSKRITYEQRIAVLLNMGNLGNTKAMVEGGPFTEMELQAIVDSATKQELDYAQQVWDFLESFRPEIEATVRMRQNRVPVMVEAQPLETKHGTYRGGYFPLNYDSEKGVLKGQQNVEEAVAMQLKGGFVASHTQDGHTMERDGSGGRPVRLDPNSVVNHLHQLVYDLEMGDAVHDAWKVLHNRNLKQTFTDIGRPDVWEALDVWLGDVITGELHRNNIAENIFRNIRTGTTISKLGLNFVTAMLQTLGLIQSAVYIGKRNLIGGLYDLISSNPIETYRWVTESSGFMQERERSWTKDIQDAQRGLKNGLLKRVTPGNTADRFGDFIFYPISKMQRFVDIVTWLGGRRQGLEMFNGDEALARQHADRMVARTQGSGNFHERTNFERGTLGQNYMRNTEMVRVWSLFLSVFAAKLNIAYERTKRVKNPIKNPLEFIDYATDMTLLFAVEGMMAVLLTGEWPEDEEEDLLGMAAWEATKTFMAGVPVAREFISDMEGFNTGGAIGSFAGAAGSMATQWGQVWEEGSTELDGQLLKSTNNVLGTLFKYPTSQINRTGDAIWHYNEGYDVEFMEFITGYKD